MPTRIVLCYPVEAETHRTDRRRHAGGRDRRRRPGADRRGAFRGRHLLRPRQGAGRLGRRGAPGPAAVDSVVGRRHGPLPGPVGDRLGHRRHQRLGRAGRSGGRAHDRPGDGLVPQPADVLPRPAEEGVHPPAHPRPDPQHGGHRRPRRRRPAAGPTCSAAFDVRILATDMFPVDKPDCVEALWPADRLDDLLAAVDIARAVPAAERFDARHHRRGEAGEDEAGRAAGQRGPRAAGGDRRPGGGAARAAIWPAR